MLIIICKLALIFCSILIYPYSISLSFTSFKLTLIIATFIPLISSLTFWFSLTILPFIFITIYKNLLTFTVLQKIFKLPFISTDVMFKITLTMLSILIPLSLIIMSLRSFPFSESIFHSIFPLSQKYLSIIPFKCTLSKPSTFFITTNINTINISL